MVECKLSHTSLHYSYCTLHNAVHLPSTANRLSAKPLNFQYFVLPFALPVSCQFNPACQHAASRPAKKQRVTPRPEGARHSLRLARTVHIRCHHAIIYNHMFDKILANIFVYRYTLYFYNFGQPYKNPKC